MISPYPRGDKPTTATKLLALCLSLLKGNYQWGLGAGSSWPRRRKTPPHIPNKITFNFHHSRKHRCPSAFCANSPEGRKRLPLGWWQDPWEIEGTRSGAMGQNLKKGLDGVQNIPPPRFAWFSKLKIQDAQVNWISDKWLVIIFIWDKLIF